MGLIVPDYLIAAPEHLTSGPSGENANTATAKRKRSLNQFASRQTYRNPDTRLRR